MVILGQGYVGLPVAMRAAEVGFHVVGFDIDKERVDSLARGESFVEDVPDDELKAPPGVSSASTSGTSSRRRQGRGDGGGR